MNLLSVPELPNTEQLLFPTGTDFNADQRKEMLEQYKQVQQNSEQLATRRQAVNGFFVSLNSILLASTGVMAKEAFEAPHQRGLAGIALLLGIIAFIGLMAARNWSVLIFAYAHLQTANHRVIELMEKHCVSSPLTVQMLMTNKDPITLARVEMNIARTFLVIYGVVLVISVFGVFRYLQYAPGMNQQPSAPGSTSMLHSPASQTAAPAIVAYRPQ